MSILSFLTAPKTLDKATDAIVNGVDALKLTDEERVQYQLKAAEIHLKLTEQIANESTPTSLSRRYIAMLFVVPFVFLIIGSALLEGKYPETAKHWLELASILEEPSMWVGMFYFGGHIAKALKR